MYLSCFFTLQFDSTLASKRILLLLLLLLGFFFVFVCLFVVVFIFFFGSYLAFDSSIPSDNTYLIYPVVWLTVWAPLQILQPASSTPRGSQLSVV